MAAETVQRMRDSSWALLLRSPHNVTISRRNQLSRELEFLEAESDDFADPDEVGKDLGKKGRLPEGETLVRFAFRDVHTGAMKRLDLESSLLPHLPDTDMAESVGGDLPTHTTASHPPSRVDTVLKAPLTTDDV